MKSKDALNKIKALLSIEVKLEQMTLENGTVIEAEVFEQGAEVFIITEEDRVPLPIGEYVLENGIGLTVKEEGVIGEMFEIESEPETEEQEMEKDESKAEVKQSPKKVIESSSKEYQFMNEKLQNEIVELNKEIKSLIEKLEKNKKGEEVVLKSEVKSIKHSPEKDTKTNINLNTQSKTTKGRLYEFLNNKK